MDVASVFCFAGCERSPFFGAALSISELSPTAEVISWRPTQFRTKKSQQQQIYKTKGGVSWPSNTQIKENKFSSSVNCPHFFPHLLDFLLFIDARLARRYAAPWELSCFACRHFQGISSTNVSLCVCVCVEMNLSLCHTKHPECLCINSTIAPRATAMCHLTRLRSQSKCSQAVYCLLIVFLSCFQHTHTLTHTADTHRTCTLPLPFSFFPTFFLMKENTRYFQSQNYKSHFLLNVFIYAQIDTVNLHNMVSVCTYKNLK